MLLTSSRTAPFASPIKVDLGDSDKPVKPDSKYMDNMKNLANNKDTWVWTFTKAHELLQAATTIASTLDGKFNGQESPEKN